MVEMKQDALGVWHVYRADGTEIDITASTTCGLQEAINEAVNNAYGLKIHGRGINSANPPYAQKAMITCSTPIYVPVIHNQRWEIGPCTIAFTADVQSDGLVFDSCMQFECEFHGEIYYQGVNAAVLLLPRTPLNLDPDTGIKNSRFFFKTIIGSNQANSACIRSVVQNHGVCHNEFEFLELRGGGYGFHVCETGAQSDVGFFGNKVSCPHIHYQNTTGAQIGNLGNSNISGNQYDLVFATKAGTTGMETMDKGSIINVSVLQVEGLASVGVKLYPQSNNNLVLRGTISANTPIQNSGSGNRIV